jgi:calcium/calmodulin-dependent protein kinase I
MYTVLGLELCLIYLQGGSDIWAIGVITYFLLCGYTPFDRESNLEEMQAILAADYSFTPIEYWRGVSETARQFIKRCLTVDPHERMTAHAALAHPWIAPTVTGNNASGEDLLPVVKKNFNARRTLHAAIDTIRAINKLREGGAQGMMNGALSRNPPRAQQQNVGNSDRMEVEGEPGEEFVHQGSDEMDIDSQGHGRGQTEEQISVQAKKIAQTTAGLWQKR